MAARRARKDFNPLIRYGVPLERWLAMTQKERNRYHRSFWSKCHPEYYSAYKRRYSETNREDLRAYSKKYYWTNPERRRDQQRESYWRHHEKQLERYRARRAKQKSLHALHHNPDRVYRRVLAAVPTRLPKFARDDIAGMICVAVLEGKLLVDNIEKEVASFMRAYNREYDTFKTVSLDAPVPGGDGVTYLDRLAGHSQ